MINIFKKSVAAQLTTILIVAIAMWMGRFVHPVPMPEPTTAAPLYGLFYLIFSPIPRVATVLAFLLHIGTGALLNNLLFGRKLIHSNMLLPMLMYVVTVSLIPEGQTLTPTLFVNILLLLILYILIATDTRFKLSQNHVFGMAALLASSTLFYLPAITMVLPLLIILIFIYKFYNLQDITILLLGFLSPYILLLTASFLTDHLMTLYQSIEAGILHWNLTFPMPDSIGLATYGLFVVVLFISLVFLIGFTGSKTVIYRNNASIVVLTMLCSALMLPYAPHLSTESQLFAIPFAFTGSLWLINSNTKPWILNTTFTLWVLVSIANCIA